MANTTIPMKSQEEYLKSKAQETTDTAKQFGEKAKDTASNVLDKAKQAGSNVADKAREGASNLGQKAEDATHAAGRGMGSLAGTVRENLPQSGIMGSAASTLASGLESGGKYLEQSGLEGMCNDMVNLVRRNPLPALLVGIGVGFALARATQRSSY